MTAENHTTESPESSWFRKTKQVPLAVDVIRNVKNRNIDSLNEKQWELYIPYSFLSRVREVSHRKKKTIGSWFFAECKVIPESGLLGTFEEEWKVWSLERLNQFNLATSKFNDRSLSTQKIGRSLQNLRGPRGKKVFWRF